MTFVIAASPEIAIAARRLLAPERFTALRIASPTASASTMAFSLMALCGVGSAAYDSTRYWPPDIVSSISFTDEVVMSSPKSGRYLLPNDHTTALFPFSLSTLEVESAARDYLARANLARNC